MRKRRLGHIKDEIFVEGIPPFLIAPLGAPCSANDISLFWTEATYRIFELKPIVVIPMPPKGGTPNFPRHNPCQSNNERYNQIPKEDSVMGLILLVLLIILLLGAVPAWPYSRNWGYGPSGGLGLIVLIVIILLVLHVF
jgi:Protein of unknown function (DUF3309)